jgi:hypothetical protein
MKNQQLTIGLMKKIFLLAFAGLIISPCAKAQLPTAQQIANKMKIGWNLGNTLYKA